MEGPLRGCLAGAAAWKFGGGCLSMIVIFIIVYIFAGSCEVLKLCARY